MYQVDPPLPVAELDPGTYFVVGGPMTAKYELLLSVVAHGLEDGENGLFVTVDRGVEGIGRDFAARAGADDPRLPDRLAVVDCMSEQSGGHPVESPRVDYASSPGDLTGIGMYASEALGDLAGPDADPTRVAVDSVSTMLMYADFELVVRFLHVLTGRLAAADALGLFALDPESVDEREREAILGLADGLIELRAGDDGDELRVVAGGDRTDWRPFPVE